MGLGKNNQTIALMKSWFTIYIVFKETVLISKQSRRKGSRSSCVVTPFAVFNGTEINVIPGRVGSSLVSNQNGCKEHCYDNTDCTWNV